MSPSSITSLASAFGGDALDNWNIRRTAKKLGIFTRVTEAASPLTSRLQCVLPAAHVESLTFREQATISTAPQEEGAFASYDKIAHPYQATIRMVCDGTDSGDIFNNLLPDFLRTTLNPNNSAVAIRSRFIATLAALVKDTKFYIIATPEKIYPRANITGYSYSRQNTGGTELITADITIEEVRHAGNTGWATTPRHPQGAALHDNGTVTPMPLP